MQRPIRRVILLVVIFFGVNLFAQFMEPTTSDYQSFIHTLQTADPTSFLAICILIAQGIFILLRTLLGNILGIYKLLILATLNVVVTVGLKYLAGKSLIESLVFDATTLMSYQIAANEWYKHIIELQRGKCDDEEADSDADDSGDSGMFNK